MSTVVASSSVVAPEGRAPDDPGGADRLDRDPSLLGYYRDLVEPFGHKVDAELLRSGPHVYHRDLVEHLVDDDIRTTAPDLVIVTHALPDVTPFTAAAAHLSMLLGGGATTLGISQQGLAAPFTAVRVADLFRRSGRSTRALVAVLEQTTLPTEHALVRDTPLVDSGAAVVLGDDDGPELAEVLSIGSEAMPATVRRIVERDPKHTLLVAGPWNSDDLDTVDRHEVGTGSYCTSVWLELARHWTRWSTQYRTVVLCDTDPLTHRGSVAVFSCPR